MQTYTENVLAKEASDCLQQFNIIKTIINLAEFKEVEKLSCHVLAQAFADLFDLKVEHGYYVSIFEHSWCVDKKGNIIDIYPVGIINAPILIVSVIARRMREAGLYKINDSLDVLSSPQLAKDVIRAKIKIMKILTNLKVV